MGVGRGLGPAGHGQKLIDVGFAVGDIDEDRLRMLPRGLVAGPQTLEPFAAFLLIDPRPSVAGWAQ